MSLSTTNGFLLLPLSYAPFPPSPSLFPPSSPFPFPPFPFPLPLPLPPSLPVYLLKYVSFYVYIFFFSAGIFFLSVGAISETHFLWRLTGCPLYFFLSCHLYRWIFSFRGIVSSILEKEDFFLFTSFIYSCVRLFISLPLSRINIRNGSPTLNATLTAGSNNSCLSCAVHWPA